MAPGRAESDFGQQGRIDTLGPETDLFNFQFVFLISERSNRSDSSSPKCIDIKLPK